MDAIALVSSNNAIFMGWVECRHCGWRNTIDNTDIGWRIIWDGDENKEVLKISVSCPQCRWYLGEIESPIRFLKYDNAFLTLE